MGEEKKKKAKVPQPFLGRVYSFVCIKAFLSLTLMTETRWARKGTRMRKFVTTVLHQDPSTKAFGLVKSRALDEPEPRGSEEIWEDMKETWVRQRRSIHGGQGKRGLSQVDTQESREETRTGLRPAAVQYRAPKSHHPSTGSKDHEIHWCGMPACSKTTLH